MKLRSLLGKRAPSLALKTYVEKTYPKRFRKFRRKIEDDYGYLSSRANGIAFGFEGRPFRICAIFLYSQGHEGYKRYRRSLPGHVRFRYKREDVRAAFGPPNETSDGGGTFYGVSIPAWDLYQRPDVTLNFQYHQKTGSITLLTLMPADWTPEHTMKHKSGCIQDKIQRDSA